MTGLTHLWERHWRHRCWGRENPGSQCRVWSNTPPILIFGNRVRVGQNRKGRRGGERAKNRYLYVFVYAAKWSSANWCCSTNSHFQQLSQSWYRVGWYLCAPVSRSDDSVIPGFGRCALELPAWGIFTTESVVPYGGPPQKEAAIGELPIQIPAIPM